MFPAGGGGGITIATIYASCRCLAQVGERGRGEVHTPYQANSKATVTPTMQQAKGLRRPVGPATRRGVLVTPEQSSSVRSQTHGIPAWEHPKGSTAVASSAAPRLPQHPTPRHPQSSTKAPPGRIKNLQPNSSTDHHAMLKAEGPRPNHMLITFNSETDSCCPSLGDITCDYSEAQAFQQSAAVMSSQYYRPRHNNYEKHINIAKSPTLMNKAKFSTKKPSHMNGGGSSPQPRKNRVHSPHKELVSPQRIKTKVGSPRKDIPSAQTGKVMTSPLKSRGLPPAPKLSAPPASTTKRALRNTTEADIVFQMGGLSFRDAPPDVNAASIAAEKKRAKATTNNSLNTSDSSLGSLGEIVLPANRTLENIVLPVAPKFSKAEKANPSTNVVSNAPKRRPVAARSDASTKQSPAKDSKPKETRHVKEQGSRPSGLKSPVQKTQVRKKSDPHSKIGRVPMSACEIEDSCLRQLNSRSSDATVLATNKREIVLLGTSTNSTRNRDFLPAPLHDKESCASSELQKPSNGIMYDLDSSMVTTHTATTSSTCTGTSTTKSETLVCAVFENDNQRLTGESSNGSKSKLRCHKRIASGSPLYSYSDHNGNLEGPQHLGDSHSNLERSIQFDDETDGSASLAVIEQENEMVKLALERSLHDYSHHSCLSLASESSAASFCGMQTLENESDDGDDAVDIHCALALSASIADGSVAGESRYSNSALHDSIPGVPRYLSEGASFSTRSRHSMMNDSMSRFSSRGDLTYHAGMDTMTKYSNAWERDQTSDRWYMQRDNEDQSVAEEEEMVTGERDARMG